MFEPHSATDMNTVPETAGGGPPDGATHYRVECPITGRKSSIQIVQCIGAVFIPDEATQPNFKIWVMANFLATVERFDHIGCIGAIITHLDFFPKRFCFTFQYPARSTMKLKLINALLALLFLTPKPRRYYAVGE
jgi:hypothetical protein